MEMQPIYQDLPELYRFILPEFFEELVPIETGATCNSCAMCLKEGETAIPGVEYFKPDVKCCSYFPKLPNYLVGGLLNDTNPAMDEGRRRIRERIRNRVAITPRAVDAPKKYTLLSKFGGQRNFGKNSALLCPYFVKDGGLCSIWKFRDSICSTYFCKTVTGSFGTKFWQSLRTYLVHMQEALSWYAMQTLNSNTEAIWEYVRGRENDNLDSEDLDEKAPSEEIYKRLWGDWFGREEEFYRESYQIVSKLSREDVSRISGVFEKMFLQWVKERHNDVVHPKIPPVLRRNPELQASPIQDGASYMVRTDLGGFALQKALFDILGWFDGTKTVEDIRKMVREQYDDELGDELLQSLYFNRMLIPA